jgi:hypothetical protein
VSNQVLTKKGTVLPLLNLKGKKYLMVAYRIQWMNEEVDSFSVVTEFPLITDEQAIAKATVSIMDKDGRVIKSAQATKRETKKDFPDFTEKAETAAIGRAVSILGFGTQFALSDLDEGKRLADSPLEDTKPEPKIEEVKEETPAPEQKKSSSFRKPKVVKEEPPVVEVTKPVVTAEQEEEWS